VSVEVFTITLLKKEEVIVSLLAGIVRFIVVKVGAGVELSLYV